MLPTFCLTFLCKTVLWKHKSWQNANPDVSSSEAHFIRIPIDHLPHRNVFVTFCICSLFDAGSRLGESSPRCCAWGPTKREYLSHSIVSHRWCTDNCQLGSSIVSKLSASKFHHSTLWSSSCQVTVQPPLWHEGYILGVLGVKEHQEQGP